jgi:hypothetical protein
VAKAARLIGAGHLIELGEQVAAAFTRLLTSGTAADKGCAAKIAIARALNQIEYDDAELFLNGMRHRQPEPVWGGSEDTAVDLRAVCAMGLAGSTYAFKWRELVDLMVDAEWQARAGAIRAVAALGSETASLLLRFKAFTGDAEPEVMSDCFAGLLAVSGSEAVPLVAAFAEFKSRGLNPESREAAILALGASRRADAVERLKELFGRTADDEGRRSLLLSLSTSRTAEAIDFLIGLVRDGGDRTSSIAAAALQIHRDSELARKVQETLEARTRRPSQGSDQGLAG